MKQSAQSNPSLPCASRGLFSLSSPQQVTSPDVAQYTTGPAGLKIIPCIRPHCGGRVALMETFDDQYRIIVEYRCRLCHREYDENGNLIEAIIPSRTRITPGGYKRTGAKYYQRKIPVRG